MSKRSLNKSLLIGCLGAEPEGYMPNRSGHPAGGHQRELEREVLR